MILGFFVLYINICTFFVFSLWFYYDYRQALFYAKKSRWSPVYCKSCQLTYSTKDKNRLSACPLCRKEHASLQF